jgi:GTPase
LSLVTRSCTATAYDWRTYISNRGSQASRGSLRAQVRDAFRKHQGETDPVEIEKQKDAAIRGLSNYMFYEAQRMAKEANWGGRDFMLVDTGGLMSKADERASVFWEFGIEPIAVSAISGSGTGELLDLAVQGLPPPLGHEDMEEAVVPVSMAIVGRPNVGKSSLLNSIVGKERSIVSSMAGTTRDAIDTDIDMPDGRRFKLIDTAGVRKRASIASGKDGAEPLSVERAFHAVRRAEVAVLVIDATEGVTQQDFRLSEYVAAEGRACVVVVNKWDKVPDKGDRTLSDFEANVRAELRPVEWANIVFTSALTGQRVKRVLDAATAAAEEHRRRITTATLNMVIQDATGWRAPPSTGQGRRGRVYYGTQAGVKPPTFVLFCNDPKLFPDDYRKYMERQFREQIGYPGSPLRIFYRGKQQGTEAAETGG